MENDQLEMFRARLEEEKKKRQEEILSINESGLWESMRDSLGELSLYDNEPADIGSEMFERSKDFALRERAKLNIQAIDEALHRIEQGVYDTCEVCGQRIPFERLEAVPYTTTCHDCRKRLENKPHESHRPVEEEVIKEIYNQNYDGNTNNVEYDLEDTWQDVARFSEHAAQAQAGAYYGVNELDTEDRGYAEEVENIPYEVGSDGVIYKSYQSLDDERGNEDN